jgi:hypothetical protein
MPFANQLRNDFGVHGNTSEGHRMNIRHEYTFFLPGRTVQGGAMRVGGKVESFVYLMELSVIQQVAANRDIRTSDK